MFLLLKNLIIVKSLICFVLLKASEIHNRDFWVMLNAKKERKQNVGKKWWPCGQKAWVPHGFTQILASHVTLGQLLYFLLSVFLTWNVGKGQHFLISSKSSLPTQFYNTELPFFFLFIHSGFNSMGIVEDCMEKWSLWRCPFSELTCYQSSSIEYKK